MSIDKVLATLAPEHLRRLLDASRNARPLPPSPLQSFILVQQRLMNPAVTGGEELAVSFVLVEWLFDEITSGLSHQRGHHNLNCPAQSCLKPQAVEELRADFRVQDTELEAWSLLYYRYVRVDLSFSWAELETITALDTRTLRRRQEHGLQRLIHQLLQHENLAREDNHKSYLRQKLPSPLAHPLIGRDEVVKQAWDALTDNSARQHLVLTGPGGIGKTSLSQLLADRMLETIPLHNLAWFTPTAGMSAEDLVGSCMNLLELPLPGQDYLREYAQTHDILVILDEVEHLLLAGHDGEAALHTFLEVLANARVIVTSRMQHHFKAAIIELDELNRQDAQAIIERSWPTKQVLDSERLDVILRHAGGNPLGLELVTPLVARLPHSASRQKNLLAIFPQQRAAVQNLYDYAWWQLGEAAQQFWLASWLLPPAHITHDLMLYAAQISDEDAIKAAEQLVVLSLLQYDALQKRYSLHSIARQYLHDLAVTNDVVNTWAAEAVERICNAIIGSAIGAQIVLHFIDINAPGLVPENYLPIVQAAWPNICHQGLWARWRPILENQLATATAQQQDIQDIAWLYYAVGVAHRWLGEYGHAEQCLQEALHLASQQIDESLYLDALAELVVVYRYQGRLRSAFTTAQYALAAYRSQRNPAGMDRCLLELAQVNLDRENPAAALEQIEAVAPSARSAALACDAHLMLGNLPQALNYAEQALTLAQRDGPNQPRAMATMGRVHLIAGRLQEAEDYLALACTLLDQKQDLLGLARSLSTLAQVFYRQHRFDEAVALLEEAASHQRTIEDNLGLIATLSIQLNVYASMTEAALRAGDHKAATGLADSLRRIDHEWQAAVAHHKSKL